MYRVCAVTQVWNPQMGKVFFNGSGYEHRGALGSGCDFWRTPSLWLSRRTAWGYRRRSSWKRQNPWNKVKRPRRTTQATYLMKRSRKRSLCPRRTSGAIPTSGRKLQLQGTVRHVGNDWRNWEWTIKSDFLPHVSVTWTSGGQRSGTGSWSPVWGGWEESVGTDPLKWWIWLRWRPFDAKLHADRILYKCHTLFSHF